MLCLLTACGNDNKANGNVNGATAGTNNTGNNKEQDGTTDTDSTPTNSPTGAGTNSTTDNDNSLTAFPASSITSPTVLPMSSIDIDYGRSICGNTGLYIATVLFLHSVLRLKVI